MKRSAMNVLSATALEPLWRPFGRGTATVLMFHRFADPGFGIEGHVPAVLETNLEHLRRHRYHICSLKDFLDRLAAGEPPIPRTVVFTVDDGYADFGRIGAPIFARFDCPVTSFVVTSFLDGRRWLWYDAVRYLFGDDPRASMQLPVGEAVLRLRWNTSGEREATLVRLTEGLKGMPTAVVEQVLVDLAHCMGRALPERPTEPFAAITWDELRRLLASGVSVGPHSVTHPILSRANDDRAADEIRRSWARLRTEIPEAIPVFCYPNGMPSDFGEREMAVVRDTGLSAALSAWGGRCGLGDYRSRRFALPRSTYEDEPVRFRRVLSGMDRALDLVRAVNPP